jgi:hypothetical protein
MVNVVSGGFSFRSCVKSDARHLWPLTWGSNQQDLECGT